MIQTFPSYTSQEPVANGIGPGCAIGRFHYFNRTVLCRPREGVAARSVSIAISNQGIGCLTERRGFPELLYHPGIGGVRRNVEMNNAPRTQFHDEEEMHLAEEQVDHG